MTSQSTLYCTICFLFFLKKVFIAETRLNVFPEYINNVLWIKIETILQQLLLI